MFRHILSVPAFQRQSSRPTGVLTHAPCSSCFRIHQKRSQLGRWLQDRCLFRDLRDRGRCQLSQHLMGNGNDEGKDVSTAEIIV